MGIERAGKKSEMDRIVSAHNLPAKTRTERGVESSVIPLVPRFADSKKLAQLILLRFQVVQEFGLRQIDMKDRRKCEGFILCPY